MDYEFAVYSGSSTGYVRRAKDSTEDWADCPLDDVPQSFLDEQTMKRFRREGLMADVPRGLPAGGTFVGAGRNAGSEFVAVRHANPAVDAMAEELGLTADELRARLNGAPGGTLKRVAEGRFDEIAVALGLEPGEARDRFADRV